VMKRVVLVEVEDVNSGMAFRVEVDGEHVADVGRSLSSVGEYGFWPLDAYKDRFPYWERPRGGSVWSFILLVTEEFGGYYVEKGGKVSLDCTGEGVGFIVVNDDGTWAKQQLGASYPQESPYHATVWETEEVAREHVDRFGGTVRALMDEPKLAAHQETLRKHWKDRREARASRRKEKE